MSPSRNFPLIVCALGTTTAASLIIACGGKDAGGGAGATQSTTAGSGVRGRLLGLSGAAGAASALKPKGMSGSFFLADNDQGCEIYDRDTQFEMREGCKQGNEVKTEFFGDGPLSPTKLLKTIDGRVAEMTGGNAPGPSGQYPYIPCIDPENSSGVTIKDPNGDVSLPAYAATVTSLKKTFGSTTIDPGWDMVLNCKRDRQEGAVAGSVGVGRKDGFTYIYDFQKGPNVFNGAIAARVDPKGNVDALISTGHWTDGQEDVNTIDHVKNFDGGFAQFVAHLDRGVIAIRGLNKNHCGYRVIVNDKAFLFETNLNNYGKCFDGDVRVSDTEYGRDYIAANNQKVFCYAVDGDRPVVQNDLSLCEANGLTTDSLQEMIGSRVSRQDLKGHEAAQLFRVDTAALGALREAPVDNSLGVPEGTLPNQFIFAKIAETGTPATGPCTTTTDYSAQFELKLADLLAQETANVPKPRKADDLAKALKSGLESADNKPQVLVSLSRAVASSGVAGAFSEAKAVVTKGGTEIGSATFTDQTDSLKGLSTAVVTIADAKAIQSTDTLVVTVTAKAGLKCPAGVSTSTKALGLKSGLPRFVFFSAAEPKESK